LPKFSLDSDVLVHTHFPPHLAKVISIPTYSNPDVYTVQFQDGTLAEYSSSSGVLEAAPILGPSNVTTALPDWIKGGVTATLFLTNMTKPRHGRLYPDSSGHWFFCPGNKYDLSKSILLSDLSANYQSLLESGQLFCGHSKFPRVYQVRHQAQLKECVLRHVSAHGLQSLIPPSSLKQLHNMSPSDKFIWDSAYSKEYDGLTSIPTWEVLTEHQFKQLSKGCKPLPYGNINYKV
jgi:hypothetical protein